MSCLLVYVSTLQAAVLKSLRSLSTSTSIMVNPRALPDEALQAVGAVLPKSDRGPGRPMPHLVEDSDNAALVQPPPAAHFFADGGLPMLSHFP